MSYIKKVVTIAAIGLGLGIAIAVVFALQWLTDHIYTALWFIAVVLCLAWFGAAVFSTLQARLLGPDQDNNQPLPSEEFNG